MQIYIRQRGGHHHKHYPPILFIFIYLIKNSNFPSPQIFPINPNPLLHFSSTQHLLFSIHLQFLIIVYFIIQLTINFQKYFTIMMKNRQPALQSQPRKKIKLDLNNSTAYNEFQGEPVNFVSEKIVQETNYPDIKISLQDQINNYSKIYQHIINHPSTHKKLPQPQKHKQKQCTPPLLITPSSQTKKSKISQVSKPPPKHKQQISFNWKQYLIGKHQPNKKNKYQFVAIDCQFVKTGDTQSLARVSLVNEHSHQLYDSYVKPTDKITDYVTNISGITYKHIKNAPSLSQILPILKSHLLNKILIGHTTAKDLSICNLTNWKGLKQIIDISECKVYSVGGKKHSLKNLALNHLGKSIQEEWHSSVEDALVTMELFLKYRYQILKENMHFGK